MVAAMYLRKSRAEENEPLTETLRRHKETLLHFAAENDIVIAEIFEEVASGDSLFTRPAMLRLLDGIGRFDAVLCMDIDRLGRGNMREQGIILETIKTAGVKIVTPRKVYDLNNEMDETYGEFQAFMARQELKLIKNRMQRGIRKSAEEGCHMGPPPYGYRKARIGKKASLEIIPEQAEVVRQIFKRYLSGMGPCSITDMLNQKGIPPQRGKKWSQITVKRILHNDVYTGQITYGTLTKSSRPGFKKTYGKESERIRAKGLHEAIIDTELFDKALQISKERAVPPMHDFSKAVSPLAGLIKCARCGYALNMRPAKGRSGICRYYYYVCKTKGCAAMSSLRNVETLLLKELQAHLDSFEAAQDAENQSERTLLPSLETELRKLAGQKERLYDLLEQGVYTAGVFGERIARIRSRMSLLQSAADDERQREILRSDRVNVPVPKIKSVLPAYSGGTPREKNIMLKEVLRRVLYYRPKGSPPTDITLILEFK